MKLSAKGKHMIQEFEGLRLTAYKCSANVWTIGYGHIKDVKSDMTITEEKANKLLDQDLNNFIIGVNHLLKVKVNQNQFDALVSFAFNLGLGALSNSTLLKKVNRKDFDGASLEFHKWRYANGKEVQGLLNRRLKEQELFESEV